MTEAKAPDSKMGSELFLCRPRTIYSYFKLRNQSSLPAPAWLKWLNPVITAVSPLAESMLLAGLPAVLSIFVLQVILDLKPPDEPFWVRPAIFGVLGGSTLVSLWWCWLAPGKDVVIVYEHGFRWQVSLSRWTWLRSQGNVLFHDLEAFSYRSDCFEPEPVEGKRVQTTGEKLARLLLNLNLPRHDIRLHLKNDQEIGIEKFFARFSQDDLHHFIDHLSAIATPNKIEI